MPLKQVPLADMFSPVSAWVSRSRCFIFIPEEQCLPTAYRKQFKRKKYVWNRIIYIKKTFLLCTYDQSKCLKHLVFILVNSVTNETSANEQGLIPHWDARGLQRELACNPWVSSVPTCSALLWKIKHHFSWNKRLKWNAVKAKTMKINIHELQVRIKWNVEQSEQALMSTEYIF